MRETLLELSALNTNQIDLDLPLENMEQVKRSLDDMSVSFTKKNKNNRESIDIYNNNKFLFSYTKANYPNNKFLGQSICNDKFETEFYLGLNKVPTPESKVFTEKELTLAQSFIEDLSEPFVVKALNLREGVGVFTDVNHSNFLKNWNDCLTIQKKRGNKKPKVLIQNQIDGLEIRVNITEGIIESAILRLQGYLIGDGNSSIEELVKIKNEEKKRNPHINKYPIVFDDAVLNNLKKIGKDQNSILEEEEIIILNKKPELYYGMETFNVTEIVHPNILTTGLNAVTAIPGLHTGGVDIIIPNLSSDTGSVIEVNKNPAFNLSLYVDKGETGNPLKDIFQSHILESRIMDDDIREKDDINAEEFSILLERFKYLYNKDKYNRNIITHYHNSNKNS